MTSWSSHAVHGTAVFAADGINIRHRPRLDSPVVGHAFRGQHAILIHTTSGDTVNGCWVWYLVRNVDTSVTGYVAAGMAHLADVMWICASVSSADSTATSRHHQRMTSR
jgi:hypothetical protein